MRNTFKKSFAILLVVCMLLASVPFTASAAAAEATTLAQLQSALASGVDVIDVTANIELTAAITVSGKATITSTNGSSILRAASYKSYMFVVADGGELTLENITVNGNRTSYETAQLATEMIVVQDGGILNFNDGALLTTNRGNAAVSGGGITVVGTLNINGGSITNIHMHNSGSATTQFGAAITVAGGTVNMYGGVIGGEGGQNDGRNGAIGVVSGTFNMYGGAIEGNVANEQGGGAGGIHISAAGTFNMENGSVINNNSRRNGGGFYNEGTLNISGGLISGNTATYTDKNDPTIFFGGAIFNTGVLNITGGEISGNTAKSCGGAVYNLGTMTVSGGTISGNASQMYSAGGIFVDGNGTLTVSGGFITNNTAGQFGGAIAVTSTNAKALVITGGAFSGNACGANQCGGDIYITTANSSNVNTSYSYECKTYTLFIDNVGARYSASNAKPATSNVLTAGYGYVFAENGEGHKFGDWAETKAPTCTEKGSRERTCPNCGKVDVEAIAALGHSWNAGKVTTEATCTTPGEKLYTCTVCGATKTEVIKATGHTAGAVTTIQPTCTEDGSKSYTCTVCGEKIVETLPKTGHKSTTTTVAATCTVDGYTSVTCTVCFEELRHTVIPAPGHKAGEWVVTKEPTRQETGLKELKCAVCGETIDTEILPVIPDPTVSIVTVEAAQGASDVKVPVTFVGNDGIWSMGFYVYYDAALDLNGVIEGELFEKIIDSYYNVDPATDATAAAAFAAAGVSTDGVLCYKFYTESLSLENVKGDGTLATLVFDLPNNDTYEFEIGIIALDGYTVNNEGVELEYYTNDGAILIPALDPCDHVAGEWVETKAPTCTAAGEKTQSCVNCGKLMNTASVAATGHAYGEAVETKAPTCTVAGVATATCANCGATKTSSIAPIGHDYGEYVETKAPTCTEAGVATATCANCGATKTQPIAAPGHSWSDYVETKAPTCTEAGVATATCSVCGATETIEVPKKGHTPGEWVVEIEPGATTEGLRTKRCTVCGELVDSEKIPATEISKIIVDSVEAVTGAEATVDVAIEYNPGVYGMLVYVYYDAALELTAIEAGDVFAELTYDESVFNMAPDYLADCVAAFEECGVDAAGKKVTAIYLESADLDDVTADGILFGATFAVPEGAEAAYEIGVAYSAENVYNAEYENVALELVSGEIVAREVVCEHEWSDWETTQEGDCTTDKIEERSCGLCGKVETKTTKAPGHAWGDVVTVAPTCTEAGSETKTCGTCGEVETKVIAAPGHKAGEWVIEGDMMVQYCAVCGEKLNEKEIANIPTITVDNVSVVTGNAATVPVYLTGNDGFWATRMFIYYDAALTLVGVNNGEIAADSEVSIGDYEQAPGSFAAADAAFAECGVDATGMEFVCIYIEADELADILGNGTLVTLEFAAAEIGAYEIGVAALAEDCFNNAEEAVAYEFVAGALNVTEKPACAHIAGEPVAVAPTCTEDGFITVSCTVCGEIISQVVVPTTGHVAGEWEYTEDAKVLTCTACGEVILEIALPAADAVQYVASNVTAAPGEEFSVDISIKNNPGIWGSRFFIVFDEALEATSITAGGVIFTAGGEFTVTDNLNMDPATSATFTKIFNTNGMSVEGKRTICVYLEANELENYYGDGLIATVTFAGAEAGIYEIALICDLPYDTFDVDANDIAVEFENAGVVIAEEQVEECKHENTVVEGAFDATCTEDGYTGDTYCADCGELVAEGEAIEAHGHTPGEWVVEGNKKVQYCEVCGEKLAEEIIVIPPVDVNLGDINGDGRINSRDISLLSKYISKEVSSYDIYAENADLNGDGRVNAKDVSMLKQLVQKDITADDLG